MDTDTLSRIQKAIRGESLDGWLFSNFHHRDRLSDEILELPLSSTNSRQWLYGVPARGEPLAIVNSIERSILDSLPGKKLVYSGEEEFDRGIEAIRALSPEGTRWAAHLSEELPILSFLDAGLASRLTRKGFELCPAASLIQRTRGLLDSKGMESQERTARQLLGIVDLAWEEVRAAYRSGTSLTEGKVRHLILEEFRKRGLSTDHPPIVAAGKHSADPHFDFTGEGEVFREGDVIQLDLWAKEASPASIYADISWVGVYAPQADPETERTFRDLAAARDLAVSSITNALASGRRPSGAEIDVGVRDFLCSRGWGSALRHRTGHGIDTECHGSGVNLDSYEFPDHRLLLDGASVSVEPGLYLENYGLRTEIDLCVVDGCVRIPGSRVQTRLLDCGKR